MYYKVTRLDGILFKSAITRGQWDNTYKPGAMKYFKDHNKTFVCNSIEKARYVATYIVSSTPKIIWEVECVDPVLINHTHMEFSTSLWSSYWREVQFYSLASDRFKDFRDCQGIYTIVASGVKLVRVIEGYIDGKLEDLELYENFRRAMNFN